MIVGQGLITAGFGGQSIILSPDGTQAYMYIQGNPNGLDEVYLYANPSNHNGLRTPFSLVKTILPDPSQQTTTATAASSR